MKDGVVHSSMDGVNSKYRTYGDDGDPLEVLPRCSEPLQPMTLVRVCPTGVIFMLDNGKNDEKI